MVELPPSALALIDSAAHVHLATVNPDGRPQVTMVWSTVEDGEICIGSCTRHMRQKLRNVQRDPRVTLSYESPDRDEVGLSYNIVIYGTARLTQGGAPALVRRLAPRFLYPGVQFPRGDNPPEGWIMRITPERWHGYGPWGSGPEKA
jgi:PPOX class probable F420-dependent enzyme